MKHLTYRPEIDGLRALAVMSVIIFHAGVDAMSGGFIGVDVFYVISGFLITRIILGDLQKDTFSFSSFYARRLKRLLPAALFLILATLIFGAFILSPNRYMELSKSAVFSNLFMANIWFMKNSGYFDLSTQISPLVHMWSLSVEEQFYLIFPAIVLIANRFGGLKAVKFVLALTFIVSLYLSITLSASNPNFAFYMLPTRAWELLLGAGINFLIIPKSEFKKLANLFSLSGFALLVWGLVSINHHDMFPGYLAAIPAIGTALIIYSILLSKNWVGNVLSFKPVVFIGKISYSAYLWHWPLVVYYRIYVNERAFHSAEILGLVIASLIFGYLSWRYVEETTRHVAWPTKKVFKSFRWGTLLAVLLSIGVYYSDGLSFRVSPEQAAFTDDDLMWDWECTERIKLSDSFKESFCVVGKPWDAGVSKGIIWGDSHSLHWAQIFDAIGKQKNISFVIAPEKCPAFLDQNLVSSHYPRYPNFTRECTVRNRAAAKWLADNKNVQHVVLASAWSGHVRMLYNKSERTNQSSLSLAERAADVGQRLAVPAFESLVKKFPTRKILLLGDVPRPNKILNECALSEKTRLLRQRCKDSDYRYLTSSEVQTWHKASDSMLLSVAKQFNHVSTILPTEKLCSTENCPTYFNQEILYKDENHLRRNLSQETVNRLIRAIGLGSYFSNKERNSSNTEGQK